MQCFCRICFVQIPDTSSSVYFDHESHKHRLIFCIPEVNLQANSNTKLCNDCIAALNLTYKFKMKCREVENQIKKRQFNVTENSMVAQSNCVDNSIYTVCRTCFEDISHNNFLVAERLFYKVKLMLCIPEMNLQAIPDINLCRNCHITLDKIYIFKIKCLDVEKNIKEYLKLHDKVDFNDLSVWCNAVVKLEAIDSKDYGIKQEEVDLVDENEVTEDVKEQVTGDTVTFQQKEELHLPFNKSKKNSKHSTCDYTMVERLNLHEIHLPTGKKSFKCSLCEYSATRNYNLKNHIRSHTGDKPFKCSLCEYSAAHKSRLKNHIRTHTGEKLFKCTLCEYSAADKSHLKKHFCTHTGEKPFKCSLCEYSATQNSSLKMHIRIHTGEKPFKCTVCEYGAADKSSLKKHIRTHTGEKPFKCSLCGYSATQKSCLRMHIRTHTGEKPFKCSLCEYSAAQQSTLSRHIRTHTDENS